MVASLAGIKAELSKHSSFTFTCELDEKAQTWVTILREYTEDDGESEGSFKRRASIPTHSPQLAEGSKGFYQERERDWNKSKGRWRTCERPGCFEA